MIRKNKELTTTDIYPTQEELNEWGFSGLQPILAYTKEELYEGEYHGTILERLKKDCVDTMFAKIPSYVKDTLRVCTFNVHNFLNVCQKDPIKKQLRPYLEFFQKLDATILCLQEVVPLHDPPLEKDATTGEEIIGNASFAPFLEKMKELGYSHYLIGDTMRGNNLLHQNYYVLCNVIFSKLPFLRQAIYQLPGNRNLLSVGIQYQGTEYLVINTHLDVNNTTIHLQGKEVGLAEVQSKIIRQYVQSYKNQYQVSNVLLCGDLNRPFERKGTRVIKRYERLEEIFAPLYFLFQEPVEQKEYLLTNQTIETQTDYILINKGFTDVVMDYYVIPYFISDHYPLVLDVLPPTGFSEQRNLFALRKKFPFSLNFTLSNVSTYWLSPQGYINLKQEPMMCVKEGDYLAPIEKMAKYYKNTYIGKLIKKELILDRSDIDTEYVIFQYVKCRPKIRLLTFWSTFSGDVNEVLKGEKIVYRKKVMLTRKEAMGVLYQLYFSQKLSLPDIERHVVKKGWSTEQAQEIQMVWCEDFSGKADETLDVREVFGEVIDVSSLYLNQNSLQMLKYQDLQNVEKFNQEQNGRSFMMFNTVKKIFQENFSLLDRERCIVVSGTVLYAHGLRSMTDVDAYVYYYPDPSKELRETLYKYTLESEKIRGDELDWFDCYLAKNEEGSYYDDWYDKISLAMKNVEMKDVIFDPRYHFYFCGQKCSLLLFEVIKRLYRYKPIGWADLIAINLKYHQGIKFPQLPEKIKHYYKEKIDLSSFIRTIAHNLRNRYGIQMKPEVIQSYFTVATLSSDVDEYDLEKNRNALEKHLLKEFHLE